MVDEPKDENGNENTGDDAKKDEGASNAPAAKKPAAKKTTTRRTPAKRKTTEPEPVAAKAEDTGSSSGAEGEGTHAGPGTGDMNWDKAKEAMSDIDWDSRVYQLKRGILMLLAAFAGAVARSVLFILAGANFLYVFFTLDRLNPVSDLCGRLSAYINQLYDFIGYHSDEPVWPFAPFPEAAKRQKVDS
jgi:hypothetical protein